jgi:hypothetical protein
MQRFDITLVGEAQIELALKTGSAGERIGLSAGDKRQWKRRGFATVGIAYAIRAADFTRLL